MKVRKFGNVWDALADTPEEALNLAMRSDLMTSIEKVVEGWKVSQGEAAKRLGISRPRLNDLLRGKMSKFSLDMLTALATRAGLKVQLSVRKAASRKAA
ncbi:MAG: helix-turn-helix domain-containing protein [Aestuariivirga sp.]